MKKNLTYCWRKGKRRFLSCRDVKDYYAWDLIIFKNIKLNKKEIKQLDLKNSSFDELKKITIKEASKILEKKGYKWCKI